jgi:NAD(P)-dependent dehydrogenase (short-subunit alcohol dehydrogenase family)
MAGVNSREIAVVVGGLGGIGAAITSKLTADGFHVILADRIGASPKPDADAAGEGVECDITDPHSVDTAFATVADRHGRLDVLVNAAGIHMQKLLVDTDPAEWDRIQLVNARGPFLTCRAAAKAMMRARRGRIVNITTRLGFGNPYSSAYMASKNALWGLTQCLAVELAGYGITVNAVAPGHVGPGTGMEKQFREKAEKLGMSWQDFEAQVIKTIPVGRWCRPEDVAAAVSWVASPAAAFVTGETINVTGGFVGYGMAPPVEERFTEGTAG